MENKKRMIQVDANKLAELLSQCFDVVKCIKPTELPLMHALLVWIGICKQPTVDAVEVVRCKDCRQWGGVAFGNVCRRWSAPLAGMKNCTGPDDFCSYGERRSDV